MTFGFTPRENYQTDHEVVEHAKANQITPNYLRWILFSLHPHLVGNTQVVQND